MSALGLLGANTARDFSKRQTRIGAGAKSLARRSTFSRKRTAVSPASAAQRAKCLDAGCAICGRTPAHPMHVIDRSITTIGQDDPRAIVPGCFSCHRRYDDGLLDALVHLEPWFREELAFAVERIGLIATLRRVTNDRNVAA